MTAINPPEDRKTRSHAGKKGGRTTKERYGKEHYQRIGRLGGLARNKKR